MYVCMYVFKYINRYSQPLPRQPSGWLYAELLLQWRLSGWSLQLRRTYRSYGCNSHSLPRRTSRDSSQPLLHWFSRGWSRPLSRQPSAWSSQQWSSTVLAADIRSHCRTGAAVVFRGHRFTNRFATNSQPRTGPAAVVRSHSCTLRSSCMYVKWAW